jgi:hypothetical protein
MAESTNHSALVQTIIRYIGKEHSHCGVLHDLPSAIGSEKPSRIGGFVPDVYAFDAPLTTIIIGEAKTRNDLETERSRKQISAFLSFLGLQATGIFILAVPWHLKRSAAAFVESIRAETGTTSVKTVMLDDVGM